MGGRVPKVRGMRTEHESHGTYLSGEVVHFLPRGEVVREGSDDDGGDGDRDVHENLGTVDLPRLALGEAVVGRRRLRVIGPVGARPGARRRRPRVAVARRCDRRLLHELAVVGEAAGVR